MSSQQVTLSSLMQKWGAVASTDTFDQSSQEIESLFADAKSAGVSSQELISRKESVLKLWYPVSNWRDAQERYPHWKDKKKYESLKTAFFKLYADLLKAYFPEDFKIVKQSAVVPTPKADPEDDRPARQTSIEEIALWKEAGSPKTEREWLAWKAANPHRVPEGAFMPNVIDMNSAKKRSANGL